MDLGFVPKIQHPLKPDVHWLPYDFYFIMLNLLKVLKFYFELRH